MVPNQLMGLPIVLSGKKKKKNPPANAEDAGDTGLIPGSRRSPGVGNVNRSSILTWKIPQAEELSELQSMESQTVGHD